MSRSAARNWTSAWDSVIGTVDGAITGLTSSADRITWCPAWPVGWAGNGLASPEAAPRRTTRNPDPPYSPLYACSPENQRLPE